MTVRPVATKQQFVMFVLLVITVIGALLRCQFAGSRQLWGDEIHTYEVANAVTSFAQLWEKCWQGTLMADPPLYYILSHYSVPPFTHGEFPLRALSVLFGTLAIPVFYLCLRRLGGPSLGLAGAALLATSTFAIQYAQEHRPYSMLLFAAVLFLDSVLVSARDFRWSRWSYLLIASLVLIYTHYFGGFLLVAGYLVWAPFIIIRYRRQRNDRALLFVIGLPAALTVLYLPVLLNLHRVFGNYDPTSATSSIAKQALDEFMRAQRSFGDYFADQLVAFASWRLGSTHFGWHLVAGIAFGTGIVVALARRTRISLAELGIALVSFAATIGFYEKMKYPFDPRRGIFLLPFVLGFASVAPLLPAWLSLRSKLPSVRILGVIVSLALVLAASIWQFRNTCNYYSGGWRNESNQADWRGMAKFINEVARPTDVVAVPTPGTTWARLHYAFYHKSYASRLPLRNPVTVEELRSTAAGTSGMWLVNTSPWELPKPTFELLVKKGLWKSFYGGWVVFLPPDIGTTETARRHLLSDEDQLAAIGPALGNVYGDIVLSSPLRAKLVFDQNTTCALLGFPRGITEVAVTPKTGTQLTSVTLFRKVNPGEWQSALRFTGIAPVTAMIRAPLRGAEPYLEMAHNGTLQYDFYLDTPGPYDLYMEARNDRPGPVRARVFLSRLGEAPRFSWGKENNEFSILKGRIRLPNGPITMTVYYDSYRRVDDENLPVADRTTSFDFVRWKLEPASGDEPTTNVAVPIDEDKETSTGPQKARVPTPQNR